MKNEMRFCKDIGLRALDRPLATCKHRTAFCNKNCYNNKLYWFYTGMHGRDVRNEAYWQWLDGEKFKQTIDRLKKRPKRFRFCTRGETFSVSSDVDKVIDIAVENPDITFMIPTRAWRDQNIRRRIERRIFPLPNVRVLASLDPLTTQRQVKSLTKAGWSTIFYGNDYAPLIEGSFKCPKTWRHKEGHCARCRSGCFNEQQKHVWLRRH